MNARTKLNLGFTALAGIALAIGITSIVLVRQLGEQLRQSSVVTTRKVRLVGGFRAELMESRLWVEKWLAERLAGRSSEADARLAQYRKSMTSARQTLEEIRPLLVTEKGRKLVEGITADLGQWDQQAQNLFERKKIDADDDLDETTLLPAASTVDRKLADFLNVQETFLKTAADDAGRLISGSTFFSVAMLAAFCVIGPLVYHLVQRLMGDLLSMAEELSSNAEEISHAATQMSRSSQNLAMGSTEQAATFEEMARSITEIGATTDENSLAASESAQLMADAQAIGAKVHTSVEGMAASVEEINTSNVAIIRILRTIDEIAFQTNILALNAAVEAARAGEAGAGFAIVADEVRSLARRCAEASQESTQLIERTRRSTDDSVARLQAVRSTWADSAEIRDSVKTLADQIKASSQEQARAVSGISGAMSQAKIVTQQTSEQADEAAAASEELTGQAAAFSAVASRLHDMVAH